MERNYVHLMFILGGLILAYLAYQIGESVLLYFVPRVNDFQDWSLKGAAAVISGAVTFSVWRNERVFTLASEVVTELKKVTWPTRQETTTDTGVVLLTVVIAATTLGLFDLIWSALTNYIYKM